jgi:hypothetical protein
VLTGTLISNNEPTQTSNLQIGLIMFVVIIIYILLDYYYWNKEFKEKQAIIMSMLMLGSLSEIISQVQNHVHMTIEYEISHEEEDQDDIVS